MGGISNHEHVHEYAGVGADLFGIGSAATGLDSSQYAAFFSQLLSDVLTNSGGRRSRPLPIANASMEYFRTRLESTEPLSKDLFRVSFAELPAAYTPGFLAGKFFFILLPGVGEKPFAIFSAAERSVIVRTVGPFTEQLRRLGAGSELFLRGPYGKALPQYQKKVITLVGGGTGTASVLEIARRYQSGNELVFVLGARSKCDLFGLDEFRSLGSVYVATNDGSLGFKGHAHEALADMAPSLSRHSHTDRVFINCGPEQMVKACFRVEDSLAESHQIFGSVEYMTSCGVGICGKCASQSGALTCMDGPFMNVAEFRCLNTTAPGCRGGQYSLDGVNSR
jgi:dihydroorotate dehydrogenase (NAD+) catalytic subunit